jgi:anti-sigma-K factor RskA
MVGSEGTSEATARLFWDTEFQRWVIHINNLPAPPADKQYQLWFETRGAKVSAAVFSTDQHGRTELRLTLPPAVINALMAAAVTLEPKGGSPQPTGNVFLQARI